MIEFDSYKILYSEIIIYFQTIEHDVKIIFAYMHNGNINENYDHISGKTLGQTLTELKKIDREDGKPNISASDYNFLMQMTEKKTIVAIRGSLRLFTKKTSFILRNTQSHLIS